MAMIERLTQQVADIAFSNELIHQEVALWIAEKGLDPLIEIGPIFEGVLIHYLIGYPNASHIRVSMIPGASTR